MNTPARLLNENTPTHLVRVSGFSRDTWNRWKKKPEVAIFKNIDHLFMIGLITKEEHEEWWMARNKYRLDKKKNQFTKTA